MVPHVIRMIVGPGHRVLIPASALGGALLLVVAFGMGYYLGATSAPPMTIVEVEGGVE